MSPSRHPQELFRGGTINLVYHEGSHRIGNNTKKDYGLRLDPLNATLFEIPNVTTHVKKLMNQGKA